MAFHIPSMPFCRKLKAIRRKKIAAIPIQKAVKGDSNFARSTLSLNFAENTHYTIHTPIRTKQHQGPIHYFASRSATADTFSESYDSKTSRVSFHLDDEVYHYRSITQDVEHSTLFYSSRDYRRFKQEAFIEEKLKVQEEKDYSNRRTVDEDEEDLIRCIASQFSLSIR
eukprot:scaffold19611_cov67-Cyclotella_meneghiniana.AAC.4